LNVVRRAAAAIVVPLLLLTAACGGSDDDTTSSTKPREGTIGDVTVTGDFGVEPDIEFKAPMTFAKTENKTVIEGPGTGPEVVGTSEVTVNYVGINASDSAEFDSTWDADGQATPATFKLGQVIVGLNNGLQGAQAGDRRLITIASKDGFGDVGNGTTIRKDDSLVMVVDVEKVTNPTVIPPSRVPSLTFDDEGNPVKFVPKADSPADVGLLGVDVLDKGKGDPVTADQTLTVEYLGQVYPDGAVFDESYSEKKPVSFALSGVIQGWQQGLEGQTVGSRVVLTIPSDLAYGAQGSPPDIPANADLIFVIDILKAK
jgi:FKBP-type peptidyl-prolyl cis-trans isomerase